MFFKLFIPIFIIVLGIYLWPYSKIEHTYFLNEKFLNENNIDKEKDFFIKSASLPNGNIHIKLFNKPSTPKAIIFGMHGFGEGVHRYDYVADNFNKNDYLFIMFDFLGNLIFFK
jgi:hypothetical protein